MIRMWTAEYHRRLSNQRGWMGSTRALVRGMRRRRAWFPNSNRAPPDNECVVGVVGDDFLWRVRRKKVKRKKNSASAHTPHNVRELATHATVRSRYDANLYVRHCSKITLVWQLIILFSKIIIRSIGPFRKVHLIRHLELNTPLKNLH